MAGARRTPRRHIGLALAGGGPAGAVYEIGALYALEECLEGLDFADLSIYVGVSAGAFLTAALANGIKPSELARTVVRSEGAESPFSPGTFFKPALRGWARQGARLPKLFATALSRVAVHPGDPSVRESLSRLAGGLPVAIFENEPIRRYLARMLSQPGRTDDFRQLKRKLVVVATDLGSGRAIRFGEPGFDHVPISRAVQASSAFPGLYPPVTIDGRPCVDGVLLKTLHASVALEDGAGLVLCVNPLVPADITTGIATGALRPDALTAGGLVTVLSQTVRTMIHSRLEVGMAAYGTRYPDSDVVLFEPHPDDYGMFFTNIFSFSARGAVCELAYQSTRRTLRQRRAEIETALARHGITLRGDVLDDTTRTMSTEGAPLATGSGAGGAAGATRTLRNTLARLADSLRQG